jgi:hypothetical protein
MAQRPGARTDTRPPLAATHRVNNAGVVTDFDNSKTICRRFPPPWSADETDACFIIRDKNGQALAYVYFEQEPGRQSAAKLLTRDKTRWIAATRH